MTLTRVKFFSYPRGVQWTICLMTVWLLLNLLDILSTYQALSTGKAIESNPLMALLVGMPLLLVSTKMTLAYAAIKVAERISNKSTSYALISLLLLDIYVALVCVNNIMVWLRN